MHDINQSGDMDMEGFLKLMKAAGYPERVAQKAATARGLERLRKELPA